MAGNYSNNNGVLLKPVETEQVFLVSTQQMEAYMEQRFRAITGYENTPFRLVSLDISNVYAPLVMITSTDVLFGRKKERKNNNSDELTMFSGNKDDDGGEKVMMDQKLYAWLAPYLYTKDDEHAWFSSEFKRRLNISQGKAQMLKKYRKPIIERGQKTDHVCLLVAPETVAYKMVMEATSNDQNQNNGNFAAIITSIKKIATGNYEYTVAKRRRMKNKNENDDVKNILAKIMR